MQRLSAYALSVLLFLAASMTCSSLFAAAPESEIRSIKHPLLGYWEAKMPEDACIESYHFKSDGTATFTSGQEQANARYNVSDQPDGNGFFKLTHTLISSNGAKDCSKQVSALNEEQTSYLLFQPDGYSFISCDNDEASLETCFGPILLRKAE